MNESVGRIVLSTYRKDDFLDRFPIELTPSLSLIYIYMRIVVSGLRRFPSSTVAGPFLLHSNVIFAISAFNSQTFVIPSLVEAGLATVEAYQNHSASALFAVTLIH